MRKKILVVDSSETIRNVCSNLLTQAGYESVLHSSGETALADLQAVEYDLALVATETGGKSGHEVLAELRKQPRGKNLPVLMLIGSAELVDTGELFDAEPDMTLNKPFSPQQLLHKVDQLLSRASDVEPGAGQEGLEIEQLLTEDAQDQSLGEETDAERAFLGILADGETEGPEQDRPQLDRVELSEEPALPEGQVPLGFADEEPPHDYAWFVKEMGAANAHARREKEKSAAHPDDAADFAVEEIGTTRLFSKQAEEPESDKASDTDKIYLESVAEVTAQATGRKQSVAESRTSDDLGREFIRHLAEALAREIAGRLNLDQLTRKLDELASDDKLR